MAEHASNKSDEPRKLAGLEFTPEADPALETIQSQTEYQKFLDYVTETAAIPKHASKVVRRRHWLRLHWSTWIVTGVTLALITLITIPGRVNNHDIFTSAPLCFEHGWPFVYLDRFAYPTHTINLAVIEAVGEIIKKDRDKDSLPWRTLPEQFGSLKNGFWYGEPSWMDQSNWTFSGHWFIYKTGLVLDILTALVFLIAIAAAYEFWRRRRWHYSLRSIFIGIALVAVVMAWWRTATNRFEREFRAIESLYNKGYGIILRCDAPDLLKILAGMNHLSPFYHVDSIMKKNYFGGPQAKDADPYSITDADLEHINELPTLRSLYLEDTQITDASLRHIQGLNELEVLHLDGTKVTDAGMAYIRDLPRLYFLSFDNTSVTGMGFRHAKGLSGLVYLSFDKTQFTDSALRYLVEALPQLQDLSLDGTKVTDSGLIHLKALSKLKNIRLNGTNITDTGLNLLEGSIQLEEIELNGTKVTEEGIKKLQQALPNCKIEWEYVWKLPTNDQ